jgi:hypothetical protein
VVETVPVSVYLDISYDPISDTIFWIQKKLSLVLYRLSSSSVNTYSALFPKLFFVHYKLMFLKNLKNTLYCAVSLRNILCMWNTRRDTEDYKEYFKNSACDNKFAAGF